MPRGHGSAVLQDIAFSRSPGGRAAGWSAWSAPAQPSYLNPPELELGTSTGTGPLEVPEAALCVSGRGAGTVTYDAIASPTSTVTPRSFQLSIATAGTFRVLLTYTEHWGSYTLHATDWKLPPWYKAGGVDRCVEALAGLR